MARRCWRCGHPAEDGAGDLACARCGATDVMPPAGGSLPGIVTGLGALSRGWTFVGEHPSLWGWIVAPMLVSLALLIGLVSLSLAYVDDLSPGFAEPWWAWIDWLRVGLAWAVPVIMSVVFVVASLFLTLVLSGVVAAPFYDVLSEQSESLALQRKDPGRPWTAMLADSLGAIGAALYLVSRQVAVMAVLFLLSFTAVGAPLFLAAGYYYTGLGLLDVTLSRKRYPGKTRGVWCRRHWDLLLGIGLPVGIVPPLAPFGVVGATLVFLDHPEKP